MRELLLDIVIPGLLAGFILTGIHAYFGYYVIRRGIIFVDLALAQVVALGYVLAAALGFQYRELAGFFLAVIASLFLTYVRKLEEDIPLEGVIGVLYVASTALSLITLTYLPEGHEAIRQMLEGSLIFITWRELIKAGLLYLMVGIFHILFLKRFIGLIEDRFDPLWEFLFFLSFSLVVSSSVKLAGVLLVFSYLVMPVLTVYAYKKEMKEVLLRAWFIGILVTTLGIVLAYKLDLPAGPIVIVLLAILVFLSLTLRAVLVKKR